MSTLSKSPETTNKPSAMEIEQNSCLPTDDSIKSQRNRSRNKRKKRHNLKIKQRGVIKKKHSKFASSMSDWAENFTFASTWHLKHQLAYWKSRAKALEYENGVLHDIIRKKYGHDLPNDAPVKETSSVVEQCQNVTQHCDITERDSAEPEGDFEVSEEYIQFLTANAKYKEDARKERERLKALDDAAEFIEEINQDEPIESQEEKENRMKQLYGDKWQRISALETVLQANFIHESDKEKALYWPNIPFNFNFS